MSRDRFAAMAKRQLAKLYRDIGLSDEEVPEEYTDIVDLMVAQRKREHAALVRAVRRLRAYADQFGPGYDRACEDVLALLAGRKGRKP